MKNSAFFFAIGTLLWTVPAQAEGELNIFTWGNIIPANLVEKFQSIYNVKVTLTDYDSSDAALVKVRQGGHGFDAAIVISSYVPIWIQQGLLLETRPSQMSNFKNISDDWKAPPYDPEMLYTVPYEIGITGVTVNSSFYKGDINTSAIFLDPPKELIGKINVVPTMDEVMYLATRYVGGEPCSTDRQTMVKVRDLMVKARASWSSLDYSTIDTYAKNDVYAGVTWNGSSLRSRAVNENIHFGFPKEGFPVWIDTFTVLKSAKNVENAKLFQNYLMEAETAGMISTFTGYANAIVGSSAYMPEAMKNASELQLTDEAKANMGFLKACPPEAQAFQKAIWTMIQK